MTALRTMQPYFEPMLAHGLLDSLEELEGLYNHYRGRAGLNVHMSYGYLIQADVAARIGDWLLERDTEDDAEVKPPGPAA